MSSPSHLAERLQAAMTALDAPAASLPALRAWIDLVVAWNARVDLTAARHDDELIDLMIADAAILADRLPRSTDLPRGARVVDVGSGAGAPGLPLAFMRPDLEVTLVEPLQKRVAFLRTAVGSIAMEKRPVVVRGKGEELVKRGARFDVAISRATLAPEAWLGLGAALAPEGEVWVLLAKDAPPTRPGRAVADDVSYRWPLTGAERRAVKYAREG